MVTGSVQSAATLASDFPALMHLRQLHGSANLTYCNIQTGESNPTSRV
jgi:hypothetical protein